MVTSVFLRRTETGTITVRRGKEVGRGRRSGHGSKLCSSYLKRVSQVKEYKMVTTGRKRQEKFPSGPQKPHFDMSLGNLTFSL